MERIADTAVGECCLLAEVEGGLVKLAVLADPFEADDERYPVFDLLFAVDDLVDSNTWASSTDRPMLDDDVAKALECLVAHVQNLLASMPVISPEEKAAITSKLERSI